MYPKTENRDFEDLSGSSQWHALYTRHQHERTIARLLSSKGHEIFSPEYSVAHRWQDRTKQLKMPLFPCYVFFRGGLDRRAEILSTPGVVNIVGWLGHPAPIPQCEIDTVRQVVESNFGFAPHPFLKYGDWVRVKAGPLQGLEGILIRKKNIFRLVVSVEMLGRSAAVEIDARFLQRSVATHKLVVSGLFSTDASVQA